VLAFTDKNAVTAYPNPEILDPQDLSSAWVKFDFSLTRGEPGSDVTVKIYTTAARLVKTYSKAALVVNSAPGGNLVSGRNTIEISGDELGGFAQGIYYYVVLVSDSTAQNVRSGIQKLIILKK